MHGHLAPHVYVDLVSSGNRSRPAQWEEKWEPRKHPFGEIALVNADVHVSVKGSIKETSETMDDGVLRDLELHAGVSAIINRLVGVGVNKCKYLLGFAELMDVVHLHNISVRFHVAQTRAPRVKDVPIDDAKYVRGVRRGAEEERWR